MWPLDSKEEREKKMQQGLLDPRAVRTPDASAPPESPAQVTMSVTTTSMVMPTGVVMQPGGQTNMMQPLCRDTQGSLQGPDASQVVMVPPGTMMPGPSQQPEMMPSQQPGMAPMVMPQVPVPQMIAPAVPRPYAIPGNGYQLLSSLQRIVIKEKVRLSQLLLGWDRPNVYRIVDANPFSSAPHLADGPTLMFARERSDCCSRQCCPSGVRGWEMELTLANSGGGRYDDAAGETPYLYFKKPLACACCCLCRPELEMFDMETRQLAGVITNPFSCCGMRYIIHDNMRNPVLEVRGSVCQCGMCCRCPCDPCKTVTFDIVDFNTKEKVGAIMRQWGGFMRDCFAGGDAGVFEVEFGRIAHPQFKGLLIACALFLSEEYFTRGGEEQRDASVLGGLAGLLS
ncbi:unnamed protein product [Amoebophrya sp. A25]|nr:unnamed protein product [Amoebophrya sp. A25]|eukprot:GSA25T00026008001.1